MFIGSSTCKFYFAINCFGKFDILMTLTCTLHLQVSNITELEQRVEILEVEVASLTDDVEDLEVDVNQVDYRMTLMEETVIGNFNGDLLIRNLLSYCTDY